jgi:hypothetical protein
MSAPISDNPFAILTFIAAPAVFTNASSVLALGTGNRLARVVDRSRFLASELRKGVGEKSLSEMYVRQLKRLDMRADHLVRAMASFYTAVGSFAAASLVAVIGAGLASTNYSSSFLVIAGLSGFAGTVGFIGLASGSVLLVRETRLAVISLREDATLLTGLKNAPAQET